MKVNAGATQRKRHVQNKALSKIRRQMFRRETST
jgi:hypothetical protein